MIHWLSCIMQKCIERRTNPVEVLLFPPDASDIFNMHVGVINSEFRLTTLNTSRILSSPRMVLGAWLNR